MELNCIKFSFSGTLYMYMYLENSRYVLHVYYMCHAGLAYALK